MKRYDPLMGPDSNKLKTLVLCASLFGAIIAICLLASVPPVSRDALTHHLALPKLYLEQGGIHEIPHLRFAYYPMNLDLLYVVPLYFGNDIIPKFIHFSFALITAIMIFCYLRRRLNINYALLGSLFFLTIPIIVRLSSTAYVDLGLVCLLFASLISLFRWLESQSSIRYLLIGALFCGLAVGTKYNGLIGLFLFALFVVFAYARYHVGQKWCGVKASGWGALFVATALIVFSPWMIRNIVWTGNPVYPLYNSVFEAKELSLTAEPGNEPRILNSVSHFQVRRKVYKESWFEIALIPVRVFFQGKDDNPRFFDGKANPFLFFLPFFAFIGILSETRQNRTEKFALLAFSVLFLLYACAKTSIRIRYFSPILPPLTILSIFGLHNIYHIISARLRKKPGFSREIIIYGIIITMLGINAMYLIHRFQEDQPLAYLTGKLTRDEYIQEYRPEYASFQYANKNLSEGAKILGVYLGMRGYYSDIPIEFSLNTLRNLAVKTGSAELLSKKLCERGFTHLLINFSLFNHWSQKYSADEKKVLKNFFETKTVTEFYEDGYGLLRIGNNSAREK